MVPGLVYLVEVIDCGCRGRYWRQEYGGDGFYTRLECELLKELIRSYLVR